MTKTRNLIKKIVFQLFGEKGYAKAYAKGKIKDIQQGQMTEPEFKFMRHFISQNSSVLDIGANYGHYAIELAKICSKGTVHAFEPVPFTYSVLEKVKDHFGCKNLTLYHAAVSDKKGYINMILPMLSFGAPNTGIAYIGAANQADAKTIEVDTIRLDELTFTAPIDFIKIDVEGHEPSAFQGMENLILTDRPVILIEFSHPCLKRADQNPLAFASLIREKFQLEFAQLSDSKLALVQDTTPDDGYYFLIPKEKIESLKALFHA